MVLGQSGSSRKKIWGSKMLPDFTGVLAVKTKSVYAVDGHYYRAYLGGRRLYDWDCETREDAENELAEELDRLAEREDRGADND